MRMKPNWIPDWRNESDYPGPASTLQQWAWEFLRRNPLYHWYYTKFESEIEPDILSQAKEGAITAETAELFIQYLNKNGKDSLIRSSSYSAKRCTSGAYEGDPEYKLKFPWFDDEDPVDLDILEEFMRKWDDSLPPTIVEPDCSRDIRKIFSLSSVQNPARNREPFFLHYNEPLRFLVSISDSTGRIPQLRPETEDQIAFMINLREPINEQVSFIKKVCMELKVKTNDRRARFSTDEWRKQLRLLDAEAYGPRNARAILAKEWGCTTNNIAKKSLAAKVNRDGGFRSMISSIISSLNSDPKEVVEIIKYVRDSEEIYKNL